MMDMDIVVCTKNRSKLLRNLLKQINLLSCNRLVIVDSSDTPTNFEHATKHNLIYIYKPEAKLGLARQIGLENCASKYVFFVDDKVILNPSSVSILYEALDKSRDPDVVAVSGNVLIGYNNPVLRKLFSCARPLSEGENGGFVLLDRKAVLASGGFNRTIYWGEDVELRQRLNSEGKKWIFIPEAVASCEISSFAELLTKMKRHGYGCRHAVVLSGNSLKMSLRLMGRNFIMPMYYGFKTKDPRVFGYYSLMNLYLLYGYLRADL
jgi:glycosyltransferase involved in cell wall biosynthesis